MSTPWRSLLTCWLALAPAASSGARLSGDAFVAEARSFAASEDDLGLRILFRRHAPPGLSDAHWSAARSVLHSRPGAGWDLLRAWDAARRGAQTRPLEALIADGDALALNRDFAKAAVNFEKAMRALSRPRPRFGSRDFLLYQSLLHSYARALYGAGRHKDAYQTYSWISPVYPRFRQIQFEKMWAAFRASLFGHALGAIASQRSSYFSPRLEPESYLIQFYLFKRLCRDDEVARVAAQAKAYHAALASGRFGAEEWARGEVETLLLLRMARDPGSGWTGSAVVDVRQRKEEASQIRETLKERHSKDLPRLKEQMEKVAAYFNLAQGAGKKDLPPLGEIADVKRVLASDLEMWPVSDAEDWLDELGRHVFVGQSECRGRPGA